MDPATSLKEWIARAATVAFGLAAFGLLPTPGCGKPSGPPPDPLQDSPNELPSLPEPPQEPPAPRATETQNFLPVNGDVYFSESCIYGWVGTPFKVGMEAWDCPIHQPALELMESPPAFVLQADCKKKQLAIRTADGKINSFWNLMPDGTFSIDIDGPKLRLRKDADGNANCATPAQINFTGKIVCKDDDRADIEVETLWWLDRVLPPPGPAPTPSGSVTPRPTPTPTPTPSVTPTPRPTVTVTPRPGLNTSILSAVVSGPQACKIPQGCYLYTKVTIKQCQ